MATAAERAKAKADRMAATRHAARSTSPDAPNDSSRGPAATSSGASTSVEGLTSTARPSIASSPARGSGPRRLERATPVRLTVDLAPTMHAALEDWARDAARSAGRVRITRVDVVRELIRQLLAEPELAQRVQDRLTDGD